MLFSCSPEGWYRYGNTKARYQSGLFSKAYLPDENKFVVTGGSRLDKGASEKRICFGVFIERSLPIR
jgi:hypothetical protein